MLKDHLADIASEQLLTARHILELHEQFDGEAKSGTFDVNQMREWAEEELRLAEEIQWNCGLYLGHSDRAVYKGRVGDYDGAVSDLTIGILYARTMGEVELVGDNFATLAQIYRMKGDFNASIDYSLQALEIITEERDPKQHTLIHAYAASAYRALGMYDHSINYAMRTQELARKHGFRQHEAHALNCLGAVYISQGNLSQAQTYVEACLAIYNELGLEVPACSAYLNLGFNLVADGQYQQAMECAERAIEIATRLGNRMVEATGMELLGATHQAQGEHDRARSRYEAAYQINQSIGAKERVASILIGMGDNERERRNYPDAIGFYQQGLDVATEIESHLAREMVHRSFYKTYKEMGEMALALEHFKHYSRLRNEMFTEESDKRLHEIKVRYELDKAESQAEIEHLRAEQLQYQLDSKQHELTTTAMSLARQSELLGRFRNDLRKILRDSSEPFQVVREFKAKLKELPCDSIDWTKFEVEFQGTYPEFRANLEKKYPSLTKMEIRVCSLVKVRLTTQDISQLLCLSERTVENHRMNIRRKMGLGERKDMYELLAEI